MLDAVAEVALLPAWVVAVAASEAAVTALAAEATWEADAAFCDTRDAAAELAELVAAVTAPEISFAWVAIVEPMPEWFEHM